MFRLSDILLTLLVVIANVVAVLVIIAALTSPARASVEEVDIAWDYALQIIGKAKMEEYDEYAFFSNNGKKFTAGEAKIMCELASKHMYNMERDRAKSEEVNRRDAFINIMGTYATCTMAVGWVPDLENTE